MAKRKKRKARIVRTNRLNNQLLGAYLDTGWRMVRIVGALYDRKLRQVIKIAAKPFGGIINHHGEWNGPRVVIDDRRRFTGRSTVGIQCGSEMIPVDMFIRRPKEKREIPHMSSSNALKPPGSVSKPVKAPNPVQEARQPENSPTAKAKGPPAKAKPRKRPPKSLAPTFPNEPIDELDLPPVDDELETYEEIDLPPAPEEDLVPDDTDLPADGEELVDNADTDPSSEFQEDPEPVRMVLAEEVGKTLPPLQETDIHLENDLLKRLAELLKKKPSLLVSTLPGEPDWTLECPNGVKLQLHGYGHKNGNKPVKAEVIRVTGYWDPNSKQNQLVYDVPAGKTNESILALLNKHTTKPTPKSFKPPENPDDYFS